MVNQQVLEGHWTELTSQIKEKWAQITDSELHRVKGDAQQLVGLIQRKTGEAREKIEQELEELIVDGASMVSRATAAVQDVAGQATERVQQSYEHASEQVQQGYAEAERLVQQRPIESVAVAFGSGLIAGVIAGLVLRSR